LPLRFQLSSLITLLLPLHMILPYYAIAAAIAADITLRDILAPLPHCSWVVLLRHAIYSAVTLLLLLR